jgi:crotonobetainyl-CoA:carnitine CoA-transferase CaiB-like acyl-CoA transferase
MSLYNRGGPLAGVRVLEITKVWAGPFAGKLLAFLGAEVIKVESMTNLDEMRAYGGVDINSAPYFVTLNQEVLSVQVNLKSEEGIAYLREMVAKSDIVLENIRPGAIERLGLGYEEMRKIKPDIISVGMKMYGNDGPLGYQTGYAPCFAALGGLHYLVGYEGEPPSGMNIRYGDANVGANAAFAAIVALLHRDRTGEGQYVDVSAVEAMSSMVGDSLLAYSLTGQSPAADGNYDPDMAPHGCYPCTDGDWISIAVASEQEWQALCDVVGAPKLAGDPRFADFASRQANRHVLDETISALTGSQDAVSLAERLRAAGVPAFKSMNTLDLVSEDYHWGRGLYRMVTDARSGARPIVGPPWRMTPDDTEIERGAPLIGEHNDYVYRELLGLSEEELADLVARKVVD